MIHAPAFCWKRPYFISDSGRSRRAHIMGVRVREIASDNKIAPASVIANSRNKRSAEHTSDIQSLMRISYAVFCLTKKQQAQRLTNHQHTSTRTKQTGHNNE